MMKLHKIITKQPSQSWIPFFQFFINIHSDPRDTLVSPPFVLSDPIDRQISQSYRDLTLSAGGFSGLTRTYIDDNTLDVTYYFDYNDQPYLTQFVDRYLMLIYDVNNPTVNDYVQLIRRFIPHSNNFTVDFKIEDNTGEYIPYEVPTNLVNIIRYWPYDSEQS